MLVRGVRGAGVSADPELEPESSADLLVEVVPEPNAPFFAVLFDWIAGTWAGTSPRHDGAVLIGDQDYVLRDELPFHRALIAETAFPALDGSVDAPLSLKVRMAATAIGPRKHATKPAKIAQPTMGMQHRARTCDFRIGIDDLLTSRVNRIEPFAVRCRIERSAGPGGEVELRPSPVAFPNLRLAFPASEAESWVAWHEDVVVRGNTGPAFEKNGVIDLLAPDLKHVIVRLELVGLGLVRLVPPRFDLEHPDAIPRYQADLRCRRMGLVA